MQPFRYLPLLLLFFSSTAFAQNSAQVSHFSPQGEIKNVRRCGRPSARPWCRSAIPGRRRSFRHRVLGGRPGPLGGPAQLVYDFVRDLPAGVRCSFS